MEDGRPLCWDEGRLRKIVGRRQRRAKSVERRAEGILPNTEIASIVNMKVYSK
jgi:hypothetical protein